MELWQSILIAFGGNAALLLVLGFLGKAVLNNSLSKDLERYKDQLTHEATEHEIKFSKLHERRFEIIAELYKLLVKASWEAESFTSPMEWAGEPNKREKYILATNAVAEYFRFFDQHRIYISRELCDQLEEFAIKIRSPIIELGVWIHIDYVADQNIEQKIKSWNSASEFIIKEAPKLRQAIEFEFRTLLGAS